MDAGLALIQKKNDLYDHTFYGNLLQLSIYLVKLLMFLFITENL